MPQNTQVNRRIVLSARPKGALALQDFRLEDISIPAPKEGQLLLRTVYLSLDPYMRGRMNEGPSYAPPIALGEVIVGGTINRVITSQHSAFREGDLVLGNTGWQDYALSDGHDLMCLNDITHPSYALSVLGMPGFTAYHGLLMIGKPMPSETVVVAAASGAVGAVVGQIAKLKGSRVVGIAGGADKCRYVVDELGFDACIDRRDSQFSQKLSAACPTGIDIYFENVGGAVFDAVLPLLNVGARVPLCGFVAHYNDKELPPVPNRVPLLMNTILSKRIRVEGFIIIDHYADGFESFLRDMKAWVAEGKVKIREDIVYGLENAPAGLIGLLHGNNFGKLLVSVSQ
jgi:NADPH-dependent curcumin reductase CurA